MDINFHHDQEETDGLGTRLRNLWPAITAIGGALPLLMWGISGHVAMIPPQLPLMAALLLAVLSLVLVAVALRKGKRPISVGEMLMNAAESGEDALLITMGDGETVYANAAFAKLCVLEQGEDPSLDQLSKNLTRSNIPSSHEDPFDAFSRLRSIAAGGGRSHAEIALGGRGSPISWWLISVRPLSNEGHVLWRARDVTARREMEIVRRQEEELLADLLDNLPVGFFSVAADGRIIYANQVLCNWLGMQFEAMHANGAKFSDFVVDTGPLAVSDQSEDAQQGLHGEVTLQPIFGASFHASLIQSGKSGLDGETLYSRSVVLRDMAWIAGADETDGVPELPSDFRSWLFNDSPTGIVLMDGKGNVTDCNRAFLHMAGLHRDEVLGTPFTDRLGQDGRDDVGAQLSKVVMGIQRAAHLETHMTGAGGREVVVALHAHRIEDPSGEVSGLVIHFVDTTEQKHLETQFAQSQKMQAVGQLAGGVAHDFNNLLTAMTGFCDLLLERHGPDDPSFADIMQIHSNATRATNLVRQLLAFSRQQKLRPEDIDPRVAISDLYSMLERLMAGGNVALDLEFGEDLWTVRADRLQFDQVIMNLALNARDAMPKGGKLTVRASNVELDEPLERGNERVPEGKYIAIKVEDTGVGIGREHIGRIFEPFYSTKDVGQGTGLGLSTVYGIVRQTDGFIFVDSQLGQGTTFTVLFPALQAAAQQGPRLVSNNDVAELPVTADGDVFVGKNAGAGAHASQREADLTGVGTVLLVEDEDAVRKFSSRALREKGYVVLEASNGEEALDVLNSTDRPIDLIISDVVMPGMDGQTLVRLVRQEFSGIKVILISGYAEDVFPGGINTDPSIHFLAKPFGLKDLAGKVKDVLCA